MENNPLNMGKKEQVTVLVFAAMLAASVVPPSCAFAAQGGQIMQLVSSAFQPGAPIPARFTCDGQDLSPPLQWSGHPAQTKSFALIMDDPDAPGGTFVHWVLYNVPPVTLALPEAVPSKSSLGDGSRQGRNSFGKTGYGGPCPPSGTHRYFFRLYALNRELELAAGATREQLLSAMKGHVLAEAELMGRYARR
jgi:Raf kinase inhibitor-like YbhB/YbcL family protein